MSAFYYMMDELEKISAAGTYEVMCPRCRKKERARSPESKCRWCGERMKPVEEAEDDDEDDEDSGESLDSDTGDLGKTGSVASPLIGGAALGLSTVAGLNIQKSLSDKQKRDVAARRLKHRLPYVKQAGVSHTRGCRSAVLNLRARGMRHKGVESGLQRLRLKQKLRERGAPLSSSNVD